MRAFPRGMVRVLCGVFDLSVGHCCGCAMITWHSCYKWHLSVLGRFILGTLWPTRRCDYFLPRSGYTLTNMANCELWTTPPQLHPLPSFLLHPHPQWHCWGELPFFPWTSFQWTYLRSSMPHYTVMFWACQPQICWSLGLFCPQSLENILFSLLYIGHRKEFKASLFTYRA